MHNQQGQPGKFERKQALSFKQRAVRGLTWTLSGYGANQALRLGGNLILTRLLFPEVFGLMALVQVFMQGLEMFSDIGIAPSIIQNKRGNDPVFFNTAWTIQVVRGFALWICTCLIAWPAAQFYDEPMLRQLLPVTGITAFISGLNSTKLAISNRQMVLGRLTLVELGSYFLSLMVTIVGAWMYRSVWAIVVGGIVGALAYMILSHIAIEGERNRFYWEREAFRELHQFGRWVFFSTALAYLVGQGDRLLLGRLMDVRFLGVYTVAAMMSRVVTQSISQMGNRVLFPSFAELIREHPERLYPILRKCRCIMIALSWCASLFFIVFGKELINFLYDDRYADAGWMLQIFPIGTLVSILGFTYDNVLLAKGKTFAISALLVFQVSVQIAAIFLGAYWGAIRGDHWHRMHRLD